MYGAGYIMTAKCCVMYGAGYIMTARCCVMYGAGYIVFDVMYVLQLLRCVAQCPPAFLSTETVIVILLTCHFLCHLQEVSQF